ncbi:hypothetical protein P3T76_001085 [Phytophthora citrophthora]|uniref:Uncharacterized protein n=1 Tax=Phytophthora citrophthora TaxID=4793 RepID=A0AAD9LRJ0_9STRA|nr:hypothetical protein P3T76_001085 [Phytophthora citrophthora]
MHEFESQVDGVRRVLMGLLVNEGDLRLLCLIAQQQLQHCEAHSQHRDRQVRCSEIAVNYTSPFFARKSY